jgi:hypothetical protein
MMHGPINITIGFLFLVSDVLYWWKYRLFAKPVPTQNNESTKNTYILHVGFASRIRIHDYSKLAVEERTYIKQAPLLKSEFSVGPDWNVACRESSTQNPQAPNEQREWQKKKRCDSQSRASSQDKFLKPFDWYEF